ncbi:MAG: ankyrin repeat domain-containing protein [Gammaproteobacteria bacterium]
MPRDDKLSDSDTIEILQKELKALIQQSPKPQDYTDKVNEILTDLKDLKNKNGGINKDYFRKTFMDSLLLAVSLGDSIVITSLLDSELVDINSIDENGKTVLHVAVLMPSKKIVEALLASSKQKVDINVTCSKAPLKGYTALHLAAVHGQYNILKQILDSNLVNPNIVNAKAGDTGFTALHLAALKKSMDTRTRDNNNQVLKVLLDSALVDVNATMNNGDTALHRAAAIGEEYAVEALVKSEKVHVNAKNNYGQTALHLASKEDGHDGIVKELLKSRTIELDAKDNEGHTALFLAAKHSQPFVFAQLIDRGAVVDIETIFAAKKTHSPQIAESLLKGLSRTLCVAAEEGDIDKVKVLLTAVDLDIINADNKDGKTAWQIAAENGHTEVVIALLEKKAELEKEFVMSQDLRSTQKSSGLFKSLFKTKVVDIKVYDWTVALHLAAKNGQLATVKELLNRGIDVNAKDNEGRTALDLVNDKQTAIMLMEKGAKTKDKKRVLKIIHEYKENFNPVVADRDDRRFPPIPLLGNTPEPSIKKPFREIQPRQNPQKASTLPARPASELGFNPLELLRDKRSLRTQVSQISKSASTASGVVSPLTRITSDFNDHIAKPLETGRIDASSDDVQHNDPPTNPFKAPTIKSKFMVNKKSGQGH